MILKVKLERLETLQWRVGLGGWRGTWRFRIVLWKVKLERLETLQWKVGLGGWRGCLTALATNRFSRPQLKYDSERAQFLRQAKRGRYEDVSNRWLLGKARKILSGLFVKFKSTPVQLKIVKTDECTHNFSMRGLERDLSRQNVKILTAVCSKETTWIMDRY